MASSPHTVSQRAKVGAIGLAIVILLIALASTVLRSVSRERPVAMPGGAKPELVANMALGNDQAVLAEPLADMGSSAAANSSGASR